MNSKKNLIPCGLEGRKSTSRGMKHLSWVALTSFLFFALNMVILMRQSMGPLSQPGCIPSDNPMLLESDNGQSPANLWSDVIENNSTSIDPVIQLRRSVQDLASVAKRVFNEGRQLMPQKQAMVLTYMRSGSSFLGDVIHGHPDVFYVFEPLHAMVPLLYARAEDFQLSYLSSPNRNFFMRRKKPTPLSCPGVDILMRVMLCDFSSLDVTTLTQDFLRNSSSTAPYFLCLRSFPGALGIIRCLPSLYESCRGKKMSLLKTIRAPMAWAESLLTPLPSLKIIHLVRDPRATLLSQIKVGQFTREQVTRGLAGESKEFCDGVYQDVQVARRLMAHAPGRVKVVRYEAIAFAPQEQTRLLFDFLGLNFTAEVVAHIQKLTSNPNWKGDPQKCHFCTRKKSSSLTASSWRSGANFSLMKKIEQNCRKLMDALGYLPVTSESHLRNMSSSLMNETFSLTGL